MILRTYRALLWCFPPAFRVAYGDCMSADFEDGLADASRLGSRSRLAGWLIVVVLDLVRAITWQWCKTSVPWLTGAYTLALVAICESLASAMLARPFLLPIALLPPVAVFIFMTWFVVPHARTHTSSGSLRA